MEISTGNGIPQNKLKYADQKYNNNNNKNPEVIQWLKLAEGS